MRLFTIATIITMIVMTSCQKSENSTEEVSFTKIDTPTEMPIKHCATNEVFLQQLKDNPELRKRINEIEKFTRLAIQRGNANKISANGKLEIPCVINIIYSNESENISDAQIQSQIDVLNEDFNRTNKDWTKINSTIFASSTASVGIRFVKGKVIRKYYSAKSWSVNDKMKFSRHGGIDATDPTHNLNIWVVNNIVYGRYEILGYGQFPGGDIQTDGIVIGYRYFGRQGTVVPPYNKGRTATHEVGHYLNLRHIWGDAVCGNDFVGDTPLHNDPNFGAPIYPHYSTCSGKPIEMTMNFMDYTEDNAMYMFSNGQKDRMLAVFAQGGPRALMNQ